MQLTKNYVKRVLPFYNYLLSQSSTKFQKKTSWVKTTSLMQFFLQKLHIFSDLKTLYMLAAESEFFAAIHLENWDFSRQMFFSDHQWKIRLLGDHPLGSYKQGTTPFTVFCVDSDELSKLFPSSYVTLQKKDIFAKLSSLEKCFKNCYISHSRKPMKFLSLFISSNFEFTLQMP